MDAFMTTVNEATRRKLIGVSVATLCCAHFKRGLRNQPVQDVRPVRAKGRNMVCPAFTLRSMPPREDHNPMNVFRDPKHPQRLAIETCRTGLVLLMDSRKDARAASAGDILITRLMLRGGAGAVTDDGVCDAVRIGELKISAYHHRTSSPTNLTLHKAIDLNVPIGCGDVVVREMSAYEGFVVERVKAGHTIIGLYPKTDEINLSLFTE